MAAAANIQALANTIQTYVQQLIEQNQEQHEIIFSATPGRSNPDQPVDYTELIYGNKPPSCYLINLMWNQNKFTNL